MRLGINGWRMHGPLTGIGRYLANVLAHWTDELAEQAGFTALTLYTPVPLDRERTRVPAAVTIRVVGPDWPLLAWENLRLSLVADDDVIFCPSYSRPLVCRGRTVVTIFEATQQLHPQYYPWSARLIRTPLFGWSGRHATLVIAATEAAKQDLVEAYGIDEERIRVLSLAPAEIFAPHPETDATREVRMRYVGTEDDPYVLYVGKLTARRNVPMLVEAFAMVARRADRDLRLLVVGLDTGDVDVTGRATALGMGDRVRHIEHVPDEDLAVLYSAATAFVIPYSYESLSLTALEAQATGCPVITVDTPGLREQTGSHAYFIDEAEPEALRHAIETVVSDGDLRARLRAEGLEHAGQFSWKRCSTETLAVLAEAARL